MQVKLIQRALMAVLVVGVIGGLSVTGCSTAPKSTEKKAALGDEVQATLKKATAEDTTLQAFLDKAYGYAVFPSIGKGGAVVGGAYGKGEVFEQGKDIGYCDMTQATIGLQLGGQTFSEIVAFQDKAALDRFRTGKLQFSSGVSAVALRSGAAATASYKEGVSVMTMGEAGLMVEASIGGQKFSYVPK